MKNLFILGVIVSLIGCSASIGTPPTRTTTYTTVPAVSSTTTQTTTHY